MKINIVIPFRNESEYLKKCLHNLENLFQEYSDIEAIFVNSNSTNQANTIIQLDELKFPAKIVNLAENLGPGNARNAGLEFCNGEYIFFLDVDDEIIIAEFVQLIKFVEEHNLPDVVAFNWVHDENKISDQIERKDHKYFTDKCRIIKQFARHHMEGSVIYSIFRREFLEKNQIKFLDGLHEDVSFLFEAYLKSKTIRYSTTFPYRKHTNPHSVTSTITLQHISDYLGNYERVYQLLSENKCDACHTNHQDDAVHGGEAAVASRIREIIRLSPETSDQEALILELKEIIKSSSFYSQLQMSTHDRSTMYGRILKSFSSDSILDLIETVKNVDRKSLSCKDLHNSIFFAPNQARTCCKRFFVDGEMRGDVVLDINLKNNEPISAKEIQRAKRDLWIDINYGEPNACEKCPFLEYTNWSNLSNKLELQIVSMEQHSVCNLRCTYCDDTFYGGARPIYDIEKTVQSLSNSRVLDNCELIVWGGGEPLLDPKFSEMLETVDSAAPKAHHRILSNSVRHSAHVQTLLESKRASLVTSLDAGTTSTYKLVRGRKGFESVFTNLETYNKSINHRITVKYIFTRQNTSKNEIDEFCNQVATHKLETCYFQISSDFKEEWMTQDMLEAAIYLYTKLREMNVFYVYLDEHIWQRWSESHAGTYDSLPIEHLSENLRKFIARPENDFDIKMWGTGQLTKLLFRRENFVDRWHISGIVDSTPARVGTKLMNYKIKNPESLTTGGSLIFLSAIQSIVLMREESERIGITHNRLLQDLLW